MSTTTTRPAMVTTLNAILWSARSHISASSYESRDLLEQAGLDHLAQLKGGDEHTDDEAVAAANQWARDEMYLQACYEHYANVIAERSTQCPPSAN